MTISRVTNVCLAIGVTSAALVVAGCGGSKSPEQVVRSWSKALNSDDNTAAAALFATNARFVAGDYVEILRTRKDAVALNARITWCGPIVRLAAKGDYVTARFALDTRNRAL